MDSETKLDIILAKYQYPLALGLVGLVLLIGGIVSSGLLDVFKKSPQPEVKAVQVAVDSRAVGQLTPIGSGLSVDVSGEVSSPGVYKLPNGARVEEALIAAGGVTDQADPGYLAKSINLAQRLTDGMKIYIPKAEEAGRSGTPGAGAGEMGLININDASVGQLDSLPGVGPVTAQNIISKRPYQEIGELLSKKAVNKFVFEKIKDKVSVYPP